VSVLVAAALPLLHTKAGQRLQQSKIKKAQLNYFQWRLVQAATQESHDLWLLRGMSMPLLAIPKGVRDCMRMVGRGGKLQTPFPRRAVTFS
jgi:hypothetical protein